MSFKSVSIYSLAVVFIGNFNPSIVNPSWLARKKLIRESEADNAEVFITHPEISKFSLSFVEIQVTMNKFQFICENEAEFDFVRDLAVSIFTFLSETPVKAIGLNHHLHFQMSSIKEYNSFGDWLSPLSHWSGVLENPKTLELRIIEGHNNPVKTQVIIQPSDKLTNNGVRVNVNYHMDVDSERKTNLESLLFENWAISFKRSNDIIENISEKFNNGNYKH